MLHLSLRRHCAPALRLHFWPALFIARRLTELGLPAVFLFGGASRKDGPRRMRLESGDVVVWGGATRLAYHGIASLKDGEHPLTGRCRINPTLRQAL